MNIDELMRKMSKFRELAGSRGEVGLDDGDPAWVYWEREIGPYEYPESEGDVIDGARGAYLKLREEYDPRRPDEALSCYCMDTLWDHMSDDERRGVVFDDIPDEYKGMPLLVEGRDFYLKWHNGYWDGPLSGMLELAPSGRLALFDCAEDDLHNVRERVRVYKVYELTDDEIESEIYWHQLFYDNVGTHTEYSYKDGKRGRSHGSDYLRPYSMHDNYYGAAKKDRDPPKPDESKVIGWWFDC